MRCCRFIGGCFFRKKSKYNLRTYTASGVLGSTYTAFMSNYIGHVTSQCIFRNSNDDDPLTPSLATLSTIKENYGA